MQLVVAWCEPDNTPDQQCESRDNIAMIRLDLTDTAAVEGRDITQYLILILHNHYVKKCTQPNRITNTEMFPVTLFFFLRFIKIAFVTVKKQSPSRSWNVQLICIFVIF